MIRSEHSTVITDELGTTGFSICHDFVSPSEAETLRNDLLALSTSGHFRRAGVGHDSKYEILDSVRQDEIHWLDRQCSNAAQDSLWTRLDDLKTMFNRALFLGLDQFEGHYAVYQQGGFYQRHRDSFDDSDSEQKTRVISLVLYLNENWRPIDGGQLRLYSENTFTDAEPISGTLVCFMSREAEHEVLPCTAQRLSFAGWYGRSGKSV
jgi:SM-20-related protein